MDAVYLWEPHLYLQVVLIKSTEMWEQKENVFIFEFWSNINSHHSRHLVKSAADTLLRLRLHCPPLHYHQLCVWLQWNTSWQTHTNNIKTIPVLCCVSSGEFPLFCQVIIQLLVLLLHCPTVFAVVTLLHSWKCFKWLRAASHIIELICNPGSFL